MNIGASKGNSRPSKRESISLEKYIGSAHIKDMETKLSQTTQKLIDKVPLPGTKITFEVVKDLRAKSPRQPVALYTRSMAEAAISGKKQKHNYLLFNKIFKGRLTPEEIATTIYAEKAVDGAPLKAMPFGSLESDRANRLARIVELSDRVFGDTEKSSRWLRKPRVKLTGQTPLELLVTDAGAAVVEEMLHRIDHGMYA
jgi:Protein of unknown function (DUF2384)